MQATTFENKPLTTAGTTDPFWRLEIDPSGGGLGSSAPELLLRYRPQELLFVARGGAPYTLAFGSTAVNATSAPLDGLLNSLKTNDRNALVSGAEAGARITLGGPDRLHPNWRHTLDWKRWLLWGVMVAGVLLIAVMAWRLYTRMDSNDT